MTEKPKTQDGNIRYSGRATRDKIIELKPGQEEPSNNQTTPFKDKLFSFIDSNLRWIRYGVYGIGVVGIVLIIRGTRSTQVFRQISDIPESYVRRGLTLQGTVEYVGSDCSLYVKHKPILSLPSILLSRRRATAEESLLPVQLAAIECSPVGRKWLVDEVKGQHVWFKLLEKRRDPLQLDCLVMMKRNFLYRTVINKELISLGLCRVRDFPSLPTSPAYCLLIDKLVTMEARAERKKMSKFRRVTINIKNIFMAMVSIPRHIKTSLSKFRRK